MVEIDDPGFRGIVAVHRNDGRAAEAGRLYADEPGRVVLRERLDVVGLRGPEPVQHDAAGPVALVLLDVKKSPRIAGPDHVSGRPGDAVGEVGPALKVPNRNGQDLGAEVVGTEGEFRMIGRMAGARQMKERLSLGARVAVDQHRLRAALAALAAIDAALAA